MSNEQNEALVSLLPEIRAASERVARDWSSVTTADDVEQEMALHLLEKKSATTLSEFDPPARRTALYRIGVQIAVQERIDYDHFTGNFCYSTKDVRGILESGALAEGREKTHTERLDLDEGSAMLRDRNPRYAELIAERYLYGYEVDDRKALTRAVDALTECMNSVNNGRSREYTDGPGTRKVISNAKAQVMTTIAETGRVGEGRN